MDKNAIKKFAVDARKQLINSVKDKAGMLGITANGCAKPTDKGEKDDYEIYKTIAGTDHKIFSDEMEKRKTLVSRINAVGYDTVIEEVAYTWFNRLIAIRYMEVNDYLPTRVRVLSSASGKTEPDIVTAAPDIDFNFSDADKEEIYRLKGSNLPADINRLFVKLFIMQCDQLAEILPELFTKNSQNDYYGILFNADYNDKDSVVHKLVHDIDEDDFKEQVQIIGWMYQYYNTEPKDETFALLKKNVKITKEHIPAATQLFTPDWIVRYMVENSLGRLWVEGHSDFDKSEWKYYLEGAEQDAEVQAQLEKIRSEYANTKPEDIKVIDPCMGSGHILVYAFDVLMQIYLSQGYTERDAASLIIEKNIYGLDIDKRAYQIAYFAVMMKARKYDRRFLTRGIKPNLAHFQDVSSIHASSLSGELEAFAEQFKDADTYGSLLRIDVKNLEKLDNEINEFTQGIFLSESQLEHLKTLKKILTQKYDVVVTNPPYMGGSGMNAKLSDFVKKYYPDSKSDLFAVFIEKCSEFANPNGFYAMITQHAFMFLSSYEKLRTKLHSKTTINMAHLGARAFDEIGGEVVQTTAFVNANTHIKNYTGSYVRLVDINGENEKKEKFLSGENRHTAKQENFSKIPGSPVAYWVSSIYANLFKKSVLLSNKAKPCKGLDTGNNEKFIRLWFETNISYRNKKWFQFNKGGGFRKWYGNLEYFVNWENQGTELIRYSKSNIRNKDYYFTNGYSWTLISSNSQFGLRYLPVGGVFDANGMMLFPLDDNGNYYMGLMNSCVCNAVLKILSSTLAFVIGDINRIPIIMDENHKPQIDTLVEENISLSKTDWDSFETSWDFVKHPLVPFAPIRDRLSDAFSYWEKYCNNQFNKLKANEEELNRIFIDIYGLQDELTPEVEDKDVTVRKADLTRDIKSLISYAVGCMFGRYSLDVKGLAYAGGEWDITKYTSFSPDKDNIIPITDEEYFTEDIVGRFVEFVKTVYGTETLEENLEFIAKALGNKGMSSREVIRNYFIKDFYKDHVKVYQKRPIYWLFDSGKQDGFKALIYMHRYEKDTAGRVRTDYLHKTQESITSAMKRAEYTVESSTNAVEKAKATKAIDKYTKQLGEMRLYDEAVAYIAHQRIDIDLDDGVKVNYEKFQGVTISSEGKKSQVIDLLAKI